MPVDNFQHRFGVDRIADNIDIALLQSKGGLTDEDLQFLDRIRRAWNYYEGYHWDGIEDDEVAQVTFNYVRAFVNKYVAFEFGKGFSITTPPELEKEPVTIGDPKVTVTVDSDANGILSKEEVDEPQEKKEVSEKTMQDFLTEVWEDNQRDKLLVELGQTKSVTGEAWVRVRYYAPEELNDPFEEYPNGRIRLSVLPTQYAFPRFNSHDRERLEALIIQYPIKVAVEKGIFFLKTTSYETVLYREEWTPETFSVYVGDTCTHDREKNPYGFIPFVQIKNFPVAGKARGVGDLDDVIPLNVELNIKRSDISEVIDYHSAPITLVYGARIGNLEKGAKKVWGGLPKDAKVENLSLQGELSAATQYVQDLKTAMCEIAGIPENTLGGSAAISNTSGVALQYMNMPLIERTNVKRECSRDGLQRINKMILFIALQEGLIEKPGDITMKDFVSNRVEIPSTLPKDELMELQKIQQEMLLGLECRHGAMERLGKDDTDRRLAEIDEERTQYPEIFNPGLQQMWYQNFTGMTETNAGGMMNGQTAPEQKRIETTGANGGFSG